MSTDSRFVHITVRMLSGLMIWGAHLLVIYSFTALACARRFWQLNWLGIGVVPWVIGAATLVAVAVISIITAQSIRFLRESDSRENASRFLHWMTAAIGLLSLLAIVWNALPVLMVPICA
ncbi:MAG: hypothetical protein ABFS02_06570 [Pseudomonadota bacterium]